MRSFQRASQLADVKQRPFLFSFLLFSVLVVVRLVSRPYSGDEIGAIVMTRGSIGQTIEAVASDVHPPVYLLLLKGVRAIAGERVWALRLLSALFAISAFPFLWALARRFFGKSIEVPAWLLATSSFIVFASRFIQDYSLALLETAVATYLLLLLLEQPTRRLWIIYGVVLVLSLYTFYLSVIVMLAHAFVFVAAWRNEPRRFIPPLAVAIVACVLFMPWSGVMGRQIGRLGASAADVGLGERSIAAATQIAYTFYAFIASDSISPFALPFSAAITFLYALLTALGARRMWQNRTTRSLVIPATVGLGLVAPAVMRLVGLAYGPPVFVPVRLLFIAPFFVMLLACGVLSIGDQRIRRATLVTMMAVQAVSLVNLYWNRQWTNWAYVVPMPEIIAHIEENVQRDDLVIFDEWNLGRGPFFFWRGSAMVCRFGPSATRWPARLDSTQRVWMVRAVRDQSPGYQMNQLFSHIQRNFVLKEWIGFVKDPPGIFEQKRRWLHREVYPYKIESLLFERPASDGGMNGTSTGDCR